MTKRLGKSGDGSIIITSTGEEPTSARRSKRHYQLWKLAKDLSKEEISMLITKRKEELKYEKDPEEIRNLRTDITILESSYKIKNKKK